VNVSEFFPSKYLKAPELQGKAVRGEIESWECAEFDNGNRPVIFLKGKEKGVVLNQTNANCLKDAYGDALDGWIGHGVEVAPIKTRNPAGKVVDGLCVTPVAAPKPKAKAKAAVMEVDAEDEEPDIRF
jgi:hypothetical protein